MNKLRAPYFVRLILLMASAVTLLVCMAREYKEPLENGNSATDFSCYTIDSRGEKVSGFEREADGIWYLFIPSGESVPDLKIHYIGDVVSTSKGKLNRITYTVSNPFEGSGDQVEFTTADGKSITVTVMQSKLPSVQILLNGTTLEQIHEDKTQKFANNSFILTDSYENYSISAKNCVEIKGRGNTTWKLYEKKAYQLEFEEEFSVLGMDKAKKWLLLANSSDDSMIRTKLVYDMAENLDMEFVPQFQYVDLWIDGEYLGTYLLGEKIEIGSSRLNLMQDSGAIFEHDEGFYMEEDCWFYSTMLQRHFSLKDISTEDESSITASMDDFENTVDELASYLYSTPSDEVTLEALSKMIDIDSFAKYYLINEYVLNKESFSTSFYWYKDGVQDVLHLGPIWDYDTCMGNDGSEVTESYGENHILFRYLLAIPEFRARTERLYLEYKKDFSAMTDNVKVIQNEISGSAEMNYLRWDVLGKTTLKKDARKFSETFDDATAFVEKWLKGREKYFDIADCVVVTSKESEDHRTMTLQFEDGNVYENVRFAVMRLGIAKRDVKWYEAELIDGVWQSTVDLIGYNWEGMYRIDAYVDDEIYATATGDNYIKVPYQMKTEVSEDRRTMKIILKDTIPCNDVHFAVWSTESKQGDIRWFQAIRNSEGLLEALVDLSFYSKTGEYCIHAYENSSAGNTLLNITTVNIEFAVD